MRTFRLILIVAFVLVCVYPCRASIFHVDKFHTGQTILLEYPEDTAKDIVPVARSLKGLVAINEAFDEHDFRQATRQITALTLPVHAGTKALIVSTASDGKVDKAFVEVEILNGPFAGKTGWTDWHFVDWTSAVTR